MELRAVDMTSKIGQFLKLTAEARILEDTRQMTVRRENHALAVIYVIETLASIEIDRRDQHNARVETQDHPKQQQAPVTTTALPDPTRMIPTITENSKIRLILN